MNVVLDASVLVAALTDCGSEGTWAESVMKAGTMATPQLAPVETVNILRRLELSGVISRLEAGAALRDLLDLDLELLPFAPFGKRVWELRQNVVAYDAWYVAAAEALAAPLATLDRRLARAVGPRCQFLLPPAK